MIKLIAPGAVKFTESCKLTFRIRDRMHDKQAIAISAITLDELSQFARALKTRIPNIDKVIGNAMPWGHGARGAKFGSTYTRKSNQQQKETRWQSE